MIHEDEIISRLLDYLSGESDEQELEATRQWIEADAANRLLFEQVRREEMKLRWGTRAALIRGRYEQIRRCLARRAPARWGRIATAAAVVALIVTGGMIYRSWVPEIAPPATEANLIHPGKPQAVIYLASGKGIPVSDSTLTILDPDVAEINVKPGGEMVYATRAEASVAPDVMHRVFIPKGGEFFVELTDGTKVWLNSYTELSYPVHFSPARREVYLTGEAYFDVAEGERPFVVHAGGIEVKVFGTEFNINTQRAGEVRAVLVTGSVEIASKRERVTLQPNQLAVYRANEESVTVTAVDVLPHVAWKDDNFIFDREYLEEIMNTLSLWYDVEVFYANEEVKKIRLTGDLERYDDIRKLLYFFEKTSDKVTFEIKGKTITIR
ncbi:MAG: DUF4974 domain-containing protein [Odoribacteraceae bacterium]|jgi:ferric-dicitrate binding protein FerR (iron transport regulator)|nr:DUF4974 domain-containing protein [Odoribacteraceae bacterium]